MPKIYGEDAYGRYVLWQNADGQQNKKYIEGPNEGEHQGYDPEHERTFVRAADRSWEHEEEKPEEEQPEEDPPEETPEVEDEPQEDEPEEEEEPVEEEEEEDD